MQIQFFVKESGKSPVEEYIKELEVRDRAKVLACLKSIEELGFSCPRVSFRQINGRLWEIKIKAGSNYRIFYVAIEEQILVLLHAYKKESQKAPVKEIQVAEKRMMEVINAKKI